MKNIISTSALRSTSHILPSYLVLLFDLYLFQCHNKCLSYKLTHLDGIHLSNRVIVFLESKAVYETMKAKDDKYIKSFASCTDSTL